MFDFTRLEQLADKEQYSNVAMQPVLMWPNAWWSGQAIPSEDLRQFPGISERAERRGRRKNIYSVEFRLAVRRAWRLLILDPYFDALIGADPIEAFITGTSLKELRINGMRDVTEEEARRRVIDFRKILSQSQMKTSVPDVQWQDTLHKSVLELHDRFAIVDSELWHFGATVGGAHPSVNAFSRGWDANKTGAIAFFEELWSAS
jgi:hypothetical protein